MLDMLVFIAGLAYMASVFLFSLRFILYRVCLIPKCAHIDLIPVYFISLTLAGAERKFT